MGSMGQSSTKGAGSTPAAPQSDTPNMDKFTAMNGVSRGQAIAAALKQSRAGNSTDWESPFQKFANNSGYDDKPTVLDSDEFDKADGITVYRTVNSGTGISAVDIANQIGNDDNCLYNTVSGGQAMGKGLYVTPSLQGSEMYGRNANKKTAVMQLKIKSSAKIINKYDLDSQFNAELAKSGSYAQHLKSMCTRADHDIYGADSNAKALWAISRGYSVVTEAQGSTQAALRKAIATGGDVYTTILNRGAVYMNRTTKYRGSSWHGKSWDQLAKNADID